LTQNVLSIILNFEKKKSHPDFFKSAFSQVLVEALVMKCPKCQVDNREVTRFCKECGNKLEFTSPGTEKFGMESAVLCT
jgi:predicted amidophosphoribosyltransferase